MIPGRRAFLLGTPVAPQLTGARIDERCLELQGIVCQACRDVCDRGAIRFLPLAGGVAKPVVDPSTCNGCGECLPACPAAAIAIQEAA